MELLRWSHTCAQPFLSQPRIQFSLQMMPGGALMLISDARGPTYGILLKKEESFGGAIISKSGAGSINRISFCPIGKK